MVITSVVDCHKRKLTEAKFIQKLGTLQPLGLNREDNSSHKTHQYFYVDIYVFLCRYICIYIYIYFYVDIYVFLHVFLHIYVISFIYLYIYVLLLCMFPDMYEYVYIYVYLYSFSLWSGYICILMFVCIFVYIYMFQSINQSNPVLLKERVRIPRTRRVGVAAMH